ncbi:MAG: citrate synthase/methylcitrate synthase [Candidatus Promineifilaceae bacterium]
MNKLNGYVAGLEGVVAAETRLSRVDGIAGELLIGGYLLEEIAPAVSFESMVYLLWYGKLPNEAQLGQFSQALAEQRALPELVLTHLEKIVALQGATMDALQTVLGSICIDRVDSNVNIDNQCIAFTTLARIPTVVAAYWRMMQQLSPIAPDPTLSHAANFLYMLTGETPSAAKTRGLETYLNTVVDHGLNASTFTARVIISTESDLLSAVLGAIGALKGRLHGGAPGPALDMVFEIGSEANIEPVLRAKLDNEERLMGFGHRVYKVYDPRAVVLARAAEKMYAADGDLELYQLAKAVETNALRLLEEYKPGRNLQTNVEYYTALLLHGLGLESDLFTPIFAMARTAGWIAHCFEQLERGRLIRPKASYIGERLTL